MKCEICNLDHPETFQYSDTLAERLLECVKALSAKIQYLESKENEND